MARTTIFAAGALSLLLVGPGGTARADEPATVGGEPEVHRLFDKTICYSHNARDWRCDWLFPDLSAGMYGARPSHTSAAPVVAPAPQRQDSQPVEPTPSERGSARDRGQMTADDRKSSINLCFWDRSPSPPCTIELPRLPAPAGDGKVSSSS